MTNGKGSKQRRRQVSRKTYESNWDAVFKGRQLRRTPLEVLAGPFVSTVTYPRWTSNQTGSRNPGSSEPPTK